MDTAEWKSDRTRTQHRQAHAVSGSNSMVAITGVRVWGRPAAVSHKKASAEASFQGVLLQAISHEGNATSVTRSFFRLL